MPFNPNRDGYHIEKVAGRVELIARRSRHDEPGHFKQYFRVNGKTTTSIFTKSYHDASSLYHYFQRRVDELADAKPTSRDGLAAAERHKEYDDSLTLLHSDSAFCHTMNSAMSDIDSTKGHGDRYETVNDAGTRDSVHGRFFEELRDMPNTADLEDNGPTAGAGESSDPGDRSPTL